MEHSYARKPSVTYIHPRILFLTYACPLSISYIVLMALPPQSVTGLYPPANMARSRCIACYFKQPHICSESEPTLYSPDAVSLRDLKLQDQSPVVRAIPDPATEDEPQPATEDEPQPQRDSILQLVPSVKSATSKSHFRSRPGSDREPSEKSGEPTPHSTPWLSPRSDLSIKSNARSARGGLGSFPSEWPESWERHPTTPGLHWISRTWTDGESIPWPESFL